MCAGLICGSESAIDEVARSEKQKQKQEKQKNGAMRWNTYQNALHAADVDARARSALLRHDMCAENEESRHGGRAVDLC